MKYDIIENYIEKVYGYAVNHTYSREEADELSQEILFTVVHELPKLKDDSKFEPWLWSLAGNMAKSFRRHMGKQRTMYSYDILDNMSCEDQYSSEQEEIYDSLRTKIAMLSAIYRNIIILYYYDGLSTKQISEKLNIPEGTVTWRLSEARKKLKKEYEFMDYTALRPVKMSIRITGEGNYNGTTSPFPYVYISDALSQNILYYCYEQVKTVEELAKLCAVPAYYVEDCLSNLIKREAVSEPQKGKYRTEFIIYSSKINKYTENAKNIFAPLVEKFVSSMRQLAEYTDTLDIYNAKKPKEELIYLYGIMALEHLSARYNPTESPELPVRYDGCRWRYFAHLHLTEDNEKSVRGLGRECSNNLGSRGTYQHISYNFGGFSYRKMMFDNEINVCEDILTNRESKDIDSTAAAIEGGYVIKKDNELTVTVPAFTRSQYESFKNYAEDAFESTIELYSDAVSKYLNGYRKLFPAHLKDDVSRECHYMFLTLYATVICDIAKEKGLLKAPSPDSVCDVMIQHK